MCWQMGSSGWTALNESVPAPPGICSTGSRARHLRLCQEPKHEVHLGKRGPEPQVRRNAAQWWSAVGLTKLGSALGTVSCWWSSGGLSGPGSGPKGVGHAPQETRSAGSRGGETPAIHARRMHGCETEPRTAGRLRLQRTRGIEAQKEQKPTARAGGVWGLAVSTIAAWATCGCAAARAGNRARQSRGSIFVQNMVDTPGEESRSPRRECT